MDLSPELQRRHVNVRAAMAEHELDALIVAGSEYTGFEGSVTYLSGFQIVHRYAYVVVPADGHDRHGGAAGVRLRDRRDEGDARRCCRRGDGPRL